MLLSRADLLLGELNAYSDLVPDINFFISMHIFKESAESSRIEGTKTEFDEVFLDESDIISDRREDWQEVQNYIKAMNFSIERLKKLPLSMRLLKEAHKILLSHVRGKHKKPGEIRISQNWIGGSSLQDAFFIPPHPEHLPELLTDLQDFFHSSEIGIPELVKVAIAHYQFETIHPFLDGNGRIGRLLITLYLIDQKILSKPVLYLSDFLARNKSSYFDALMMVRESNNLKHWILFFLSGVVETAASSKNSFKKIIELKAVCEERIEGMGRRASLGQKLLRYLYGQPIIDINKIARELRVTHQTASALVKKFVEVDILMTVTRNAVESKSFALWIIWKYLDGRMLAYHLRKAPKVVDPLTSSLVFL